MANITASMYTSPISVLRSHAQSASITDLFDPLFAAHMDDIDELKDFQAEFIYPEPPVTATRKKALYLCGNSLGIQPKGCRDQVLKQLDKWGHEGVEGHFTDPTPWLTIDDTVKDSMAQLVGAVPSEVVMMNSLTCNLHLMMAAFYQPTQTRHKILMEKKAFPSDIHAVMSQIVHHGFEVSSSLIEVAPREGETTLRIEDIESLIDAEGDNIALVLFSGVQYYTGQLFNMQKICQAGQRKGCYVGFDLAHAVGNVSLSLHDWGVDFACWCSYKYLNCGPGSIGGCFVHERHGSGNFIAASGDNAGVSTHHRSSVTVGEEGVSSSVSRPLRLAGWWGHRLSDRFQMGPDFVSEQGAAGFRLSNPAVLLVACVRASLDLFDKAGMDRLVKKSLLLTGYLEHLILTELPPGEVGIFTPSDPLQRGCQLSMTFSRGVDKVFANLQERGIVCDVRKPDVMRVAPAPLYNSFSDVFDFVSILKEVLSES